MVISKMNNVLVKHSRILFGLFTAVIIISFVWFFTPGASGNILFGTNPMSPNAVVGSVFEKDITRGELMDMVRDYSLLMAANYGVKPAMNGLDEQQIEEAFQRAALRRKTDGNLGSGGTHRRISPRTSRIRRGGRQVQCGKVSDV